MIILILAIFTFIFKLAAHATFLLFVNIIFFILLDFSFISMNNKNRFCNIAKANINLLAHPHTCCLCRGTSVYTPPCTSWQIAWRRSLAACTLWVWLQSFLRHGCAVICCWGSDGRSRGPRVCRSLDSQRPRWTAMPDAGVPYCSARTRQKSREEWSHNCVGWEDSQHLKHRTLKPIQFLSLMRSLYICIIINNRIYNSNTNRIIYKN